MDRRKKKIPSPWTHRRDSLWNSQISVKTARVLAESILYNRITETEQKICSLENIIPYINVCRHPFRSDLIIFFLSEIIRRQISVRRRRIRTAAYGHTTERDSIRYDQMIFLSYLYRRFISCIQGSILFTRMRGDEKLFFFFFFFISRAINHRINTTDKIIAYGPNGFAAGN